MRIRFELTGKEKDALVNAIIPEATEEYEDLLNGLGNLEELDRSIVLKGKFGGFQYSKEDRFIDLYLGEECTLSLIKIVELFKSFVYKYTTMALKFIENWFEDAEEVSSDNNAE